MSWSSFWWLIIFAMACAAPATTPSESDGNEALADRTVAVETMPEATRYSDACLARVYRTLRAGVYDQTDFEMSLPEIEEMAPSSIERLALSYYREGELSGEVLVGDRFRVSSLATESEDGSEGGQLIEVSTRSSSTTYVFDHERSLLTRLRESGEGGHIDWYCPTEGATRSNPSPEPECTRDLMRSVPHYSELGEIISGQADAEMPILIEHAMNVYRAQVAARAEDALHYQATIWDSALWDSGAEVHIAGVGFPAMTFVVVGSAYEQRVLLRSDPSEAGLIVDCSGSN